MGDMTRRDAVRLAAGAAAAGAVLAPEGALAQSKLPADPELEAALKRPVGYMFGEQITFKTSTTEPHTFDLVITSGYTQGGVHDGAVVVRPGTMQIFRAIADRDEFTRKGGLYWRCGATEGKAQFKKAGALVMIVRENDGTVRCYTLEFDLRC